MLCFFFLHVQWPHLRHLLRGKGRQSSLLKTQSLHPRSKRSRALIYEREFPLNTCLRFWAGIQHYGFGGLVANRVQGCIPMVREFYQKIASTRSLRCSVCGKTIVISIPTIQSFFALQPVAECHNQHYMSHHDKIPYDDISSLLTRSPHHARWTMSHRVPKHILPRDINREAKFWLHFLATNLLPILHLSDATVEWAVLIYLFMRDELVDASRLIWDYLHTTVISKKDGLGFAHFVFELCI